MHGYGVVLDTCVLYPMYLRDTLLRLAAHGTYRPHWSQEILNELRLNLAPTVGQDTADRLVALMAEKFEDAMVTGYEPLVAAMTNDPKDRHVLAATVRSDAAAIVTYNVADFPDDAASPYLIEVIHPDEFLLNQWDLDPHLVRAVINEQLANYRNPPMTIEDLASRFQASGCRAFAATLST